jgi:hypothetical protein
MNDLPSLLRNDGGNKQNWIKIKLIGTKCNRTAIGARVRVVTGKHVQMDEVHSGRQRDVAERLAPALSAWESAGRST